MPASVARVCAGVRGLATIIFVTARGRPIGLALTSVFALGANVAACAAPRQAPGAPDAPDARPRDADRHYTIWLGGARVGTAREHEAWSWSGLTLRRDEHLAFLRGDTPVALSTTIEITTDRALIPTRVRWTEIGGAIRHAEATRDARGWTIASPPDLALPADAVPAELVPLLVRRDGAFAGTVFLPARGFVVGTGRVDPVAPARLVARIALPAGVAVEATIDLDADGAPARVVDGEGVIAMRATAAQAAAAFPPVDLVAATSVPITGRRSGRIALAGDLALPAVPGQAATPGAATDGGLALALSPALAGALPPGPRGVDRQRLIEALVTRVQRRIVPDLGAGIATPRDAADATAGDCTTFALAYAALAARAQIPTRVVTGFRVDGARLVRHRWAVSWTGRAWIAVDAAFGAAPAGGDLIGLAVHDADDAGLIAGEAALTRVRAAAWL